MTNQTQTPALPARLHPECAALRVNAAAWTVQDENDAQTGHQVSTSGYRAGGCSCGDPACWHRPRVQRHLDDAARAATIASAASRQAYALNGNQKFSILA